MSKMNNKVYGILGIGCYLSNFNADFSGNARRFNETYYATSMAGKYPIRSFWNKLGEKVFFFKSFKTEKDMLRPRKINERYEDMFGEEIKPNTTLKIKKNILSCLDVMNFGGAIPLEKNNFSITGAVQLTEAVNKYDKAETVREDILSPFAGSNKEDAEQSTLGSRSLLSEAHYFYGLSVCPENYRDLVDEIDEFEGYTKEAYELFKEGCLNAVTEYNSLSKAGCENEFSLFVVCKDGAKCSMANLHHYVDFSRDKEDVGTINLKRLFKYLEGFKASIDKVEIYYNPVSIEVLTGDTKNIAVERLSIFDKSPIL